ncbi:hypothetical protein AURDEDRAFT_116194 [Auricularia subglabra TFB-10046 SS5]|nr:hypothetical protein AURDEDRAFT_116194 [Auricularia subglabra TFB-10046 SS5]
MEIILPRDNRGGSEIAFVDAQGRSCRIQCHHDHDRSEAYTAYSLLLSRMRLDGLYSLGIDSALLEDIMSRHPRQLAHLTLHLHPLGLRDPEPPAEIPRPLSCHPRAAHDLDSLAPMPQLAAFIPSLQSLTLDIHPHGGHAPHADDARELLDSVLARLPLDFPAVHVRGFSEDVVAEVDNGTLDWVVFDI